MLEIDYPTPGLQFTVVRLEMLAEILDKLNPVKICHNFYLHTRIICTYLMKLR